MQLIPIKTYRETHNLPDTFDVALFQPKTYAGLGSIDHAGAALNQVRDALLTGLPGGSDLQAWLGHIPTLAEQFRHQLNTINVQVGLGESEIDFAVGGLRDVTEAYVWALLRARLTHEADPPFDAVYGQWLADSTRVAPTEHEYTHNGETWRVQVITNAYGRVGLVVTRPGATDHVASSTLACPAEGYMMTLLREIAAHIATTT